MSIDRIQVAIDSDELRRWAERHADAGNHGVAHALYAAAADVESLSEQAIREAKAEAWDEGHSAGDVDAYHGYAYGRTSNPYRAAQQRGAES